MSHTPAHTKPGSPKGGYLPGKKTALQTLPNFGHGGEFIVNAEASKEFRILLEAMNRLVPAKKGTKPDKPSRGRSFFGGGDSTGVGSEGAGPAGSSASGDDTGVGADTATSPDSAAPGAGLGTGAVSETDIGTTTGTTTDDPGQPTSPPGVGPSLSTALGDPNALTGLFGAAVNAVIGSITGNPPSTGNAVADAVLSALTGAVGAGVPGLGTAVSALTAAGMGAATAHTTNIADMMGVTPAEVAAQMAEEGQAAAAAAAGTGVGPGGQGGASPENQETMAALLGGMQNLQQPQGVGNASYEDLYPQIATDFRSQTGGDINPWTMSLMAMRQMKGDPTWTPKQNDPTFNNITRDARAFLGNQELPSRQARGLKRGGITSGRPGALSQTPVHGSEYVMNARATKVFGPALRAMNQLVPWDTKGGIETLDSLLLKASKQLKGGRRDDND